MSQKPVYRRLLELSISQAFQAFRSKAACEPSTTSAASECTVIYYHSVMLEDLSRFAEQLDSLSNLLREWSWSNSEGKDQLERRPPVFVTCDDALESFFDNAFPLLEAKSIPVCTFLPVAWLGKECGWETKRDLSSKGDRVVTKERLLGLLESRNLSIGSHGLTHQDLTRLGIEELKREFNDSKSFIEDLTGQAVTRFSFPYGAYTERELDLAKEAGYEEIHTTVPGTVRTSEIPRLVPRMRVDPSDWPMEFELKIRGAYQWLSRLSNSRRRFRSLSGLNLL